MHKLPPGAVATAQGTNITAADFPGWLRGYHLPTASDSGVVALRKWLEEVAGVRPVRMRGVA